MFVGHLGAGLVAKRVAPEVNLGALFLAAMLLDALLWVFVLFGASRCTCRRTSAKSTT